MLCSVSLICCEAKCIVVSGRGKYEMSRFANQNRTQNSLNPQNEWSLPRARLVDDAEEKARGESCPI
jgi:hypothetical protein